MKPTTIIAFLAIAILLVSCGQRKQSGNSAQTKNQKSNSPRLGSELDPIRQKLFANQSMKEVLAGVKLDGQAGPFQTIADASKLVDEGKKEEAVTLLRNLLKESHIETRMQLLVWSCLRELGESPEGDAANEVLGVIVEIQSGDGYDTLAGYADGTARYLNFSGAAIFWDKEDATIKSLCQALIDSAAPARDQAKPRASLSLPKDDAQVSLLTRSGVYALTPPPQAVEGAGLKLMLELMQRAQEKKK